MRIDVVKAGDGVLLKYKVLHNCPDIEKYIKELRKATPNFTLYDLYNHISQAGFDIYSGDLIKYTGNNGAYLQRYLKSIGYKKIGLPQEKIKGYYIRTDMKVFYETSIDADKYIYSTAIVEYIKIIINL